MLKMIVLICSMAFAGCVIDAPGVQSEERQAVSDGFPATTADTTAWVICQDFNLQGSCYGGPVRLSGLGWMDNLTSSIQTNATAMETWNDPGFKGTYGYFAPWGTWNTLSSPYNDAISSISYPGI